MTPVKTLVAELTAANRRVRESAHAVGVALSSVTVYTEPAVARAVQAEQNLYARIEAEFGMLTSTEAGKRMGSRSSAPRNLATTAHRNKALVAVRRGAYLAYPGFQFGPDGKPLAAIERLRRGRGGQRLVGGGPGAVAVLTHHLPGRRPARGPPRRGS